MIKRFWDRFKYQKKKRELLMQSLKESEEVAKDILGQEFVGFKEALPEITEFLAEVESKGEVKREQIGEKKEKKEEGEGKKEKKEVKKEKKEGEEEKGKKKASEGKKVKEANIAKMEEKKRKAEERKKNKEENTKKKIPVVGESE